MNRVILGSDKGHKEHETGDIKGAEWGRTILNEAKLGPSG